MSWRDDDLDRPQDKGKCPSCGRAKTCTSCDRQPDPRPDAENLVPGWQIRSRFERWETVTRVAHHERLNVVHVWTDKTGSDYCWTYLRWEKVTAHKPVPAADGIPEVRVIESDRPDGPMCAVATLSTILRPDIYGGVTLVSANTAGRSHGWKVAHWSNGAELVIEEGLTKAKARTAVNRAARAHARALGVTLVLPTKRGDQR